MLKSRMTDWKLRSLDLIAVDPGLTIQPWSRKALLHVFPNVQEFCGLSRTEYLLSKEDDPPRPQSEWNAEFTHPYIVRANIQHLRYRPF